MHLAGAALAFRVGPLRGAVATFHRRFPAIATVLGDWYPLLLIPALYGELAGLNLAVWNGRYFDPIVQRWEALVFHGQPSRDLARRLPRLPLSEALHASYLSYYLIIYGPPLLLYVTGRREAFARALFTLMLAFFAHYLFFVYFPVQGPRYLFPAPGGVIARGHAYALAHRILEAGSSRGAAFPSSHVGVSVAQCVNVARFMPWLLVPVLVLTAGLAVGAVYGGFHYGVDATAGLLLGLLAAFLAPMLRRALGGER